MKRRKSNTLEAKWLTKCAWCAQEIPEDREIFALKARLRPEMRAAVQGASVHTVSLPHAQKTVPMLLPAPGSMARQEGVEAVFQICSVECGRKLQAALRRELAMDVRGFAPPGGEALWAADEGLEPEPSSPADPAFVPPTNAMAAMEKMMRQLQRALEKKQFNSPEEMDAFLESLSSLPPDSALLAAPAETPLEQAQDLIYQAMETSSRKRRVKLAHQALALSADCADAYLLLAEETTHDPKKRRQFYEQALRAAEHALGPDAFREAAGHFWGILETRPYMRARAALAQCLWGLGERAAAIEHTQALLDLNPNDNQGNRYLLSDWLLAEGREAELGRLLKRYPDDASAGWLYNRALWLFRKEGPGARARKALHQALQSNPFVPDYLLGTQRLPAHPPGLITLGDPSEAVEYSQGAKENWTKTSHALDWLRETVHASRSSP